MKVTVKHLKSIYKKMILKLNSCLFSVDYIRACLKIPQYPTICRKRTSTVLRYACFAAPNYIITHAISLIFGNFMPNFVQYLFFKHALGGFTL